MYVASSVLSLTSCTSQHACVFNYLHILHQHSTGSVPHTFECGSLQSIPLDKLCDGYNDCGDGKDEMLPMCDSKRILMSS